MFGGALTLGHLAAEGPRPDLLLASDMVDLPAFLGHAGTSLEGVPTVLYMHENQLTYPLSPTARDDLAYAYMNWSSMVRADQVWFNTRFHMDSMFETLPRFLRHFPDFRHDRLIDRVAAKSRVVPVGVDLSWVKPTEKTRPPLIMWNQRWEYDKDPVRLFEALYRLAGSGTEFRVAICGENFRNVPDEFEKARAELGDRVVQYGHAEQTEYRSLLLHSGVVVSTARHEFFGVGVVEAMAARAAPVLPNALSYPELVPEEVHSATLYADDEGLDGLLRRAVADPDPKVTATLASAMHRFSWERIAPQYDKLLAG